MAETRAEILGSLIDELNRFDERVGYLLRSNRKHIVATTEQIAESFAQVAYNSGDTRPRSRHNRTFSRLTHG